MKNRNSCFLLYNPIYLFILVVFSLSVSDTITAQLKSEIKWDNGNPSIVIDGESYPPYAYMSYLGEEKYYKEIAETGIHIYNLPAYLGEGGINTTSGIGAFRSPIWLGEGEYDFSSLRTDFEKIIKTDSKAKVIIRFYLDPPEWWTKLYPEASAQLPDGSNFRQCFASDIWREKTGEVFSDCLNWLQNSKYANYLAGIHVASGFTEEWFYHPKQYQDKNPARLQAFRTWLKDNYKSKAALQKAWNNRSITFENAQLANIDEPTKREDWRSKEHERNYIDTYRFQAEVMVKNIVYFCKIVKEESHGKLLTGAFYGYHYFVGDPRRGHGALAKLLDCDELDYLSSPNVYNRVIGEDWPAMAAINSVQLHGKLWLTENDTRTAITTLLKDRSNDIAPPGAYEDGVWLGPDDLKTSVSFLWKNTARMLTYGYGGWWFDMWGGWFSNPQLLNVLEKTQQIYAEYPPSPGEQMKSEVGVIVDEKLSFWDPTYGKLTEQILSNRYPLAKTGNSYDLFLRTDVERIPTSQYKVIWLMGLLDLNSREFDNIEKWTKQGITVLWTNGSGTTLFSTDQDEVIFDGKFKWTASELGELWNEAGVHRYIETDDVFYIGRNWMGIHTIEGGDRIINFPFNTQVIDPLNKKILATNTKELKLTLKPKSTILLRINPLSK
ncbi:beta-galactosidase [Aurantibacter crassamenti]|uniref:beta-galactosidase n=1 Tax=Aurantibacter crassamenti TaxID=1837375 RepID=UPI00193A7557|nr:beta-galactosidase [Aurantibacter crassamenti]MBM1104602.1 beta-galactosidase [Aurantibacter crassamenti]